MAQPHKFYNRYQAGESVAVWRELIALGEAVRREPVVFDAISVCKEIVRRAGVNPVGGDPTLHLGRVRSWRRAVNALTGFFDRAMGSYLGGLMGAAPW